MHKLNLSLTFLAAILLAIFSYAPGLYGDFEFDDQANLLFNKDIQIDRITVSGLKLAAASGDAGPLGRPISMVSFALNHVQTQFDPYYLKLTNLIIHIGSGVLLFLFLLQAFQAYKENTETSLPDKTIQWMAFAISAAWLLHPLNISSVLYIVQRMTSLSGLFSLLALYLYAFARNRINHAKPLGWFMLLTATPLAGTMALFSKENAAILPLLLLVIEWIIFKFRTPSVFQTRLLHTVFVITVWLPLLLAALYLFIHPEWILNGFGGRGFTLTERLLTESRVLWLYLRLIVVPDIAHMGIYHDDITLSTSILHPASTLIAVIGLVLLALAPALIKKRAPILALGIGWFFIGHLIESTFIPLEIAHEHRNYFPSIGILLIVFYYLLHPGFFKSRPELKPLLALLLIVALAFSTQVRASQWGSLLDHAIMEVKNHPNSPRAQQQMGRMYFKLYKLEQREDFYHSAAKHFQIATELDSSIKGGLYARIILDFNASRIPPSGIIDEFRHRLLHKRTEPGDATMLESLVQCQIAGDCKLPDQTIIEFLEIEVSRYANNPKNQATFLSLLGSYTAQKMDDAELAGKYLKKAVAVFPEDIQGRLNLAWYYTVMGQYQNAKSQLETAQALDRTTGKYVWLIESGLRDINKHTSGKKHPS